MASQAGDVERNEQRLLEVAKSHGITLAKDSVLAVLLRSVVGSGAAGVIGVAIGAFTMLLDERRKLAEKNIRKAYGDDRIVILGQQVNGNLSSEEIWVFVNRVGGVVWVQDVPITRSDGVAMAVFWHPDHSITLAKNAVRVYRSVGSQCTVDQMNSRPSFRAAGRR